MASDIWFEDTLKNIKTLVKTAKARKATNSALPRLFYGNDNIRCECKSKEQKHKKLHRTVKLHYGSRKFHKYGIYSKQ